MKISKILRGAGLYFLLPVGLILIGAIAASWFLIGYSKDANDNANWFDSPNGIDEKDYVTLGGVDQYIRIRGRDRHNPVILDLHGGPGGPHTVMTHRSLRPLTEYFTLVEWDQRGAGKSRWDDDFAHTMSYDRMVDDTAELIEHLRGRLGVEKVILVGHSWGAMLGIGVVKKRPDLIAAYVGVGQALAWNKGFDESARLALEHAERIGDQEVVDRLRSLPPEWPLKEDPEAFLERVEVIQGTFLEYGNLYFHAMKEPSLFKSDVFLDVGLSPDASIPEALSLFRISHATEALIVDLYERDFRTELGTHYEVPMFMFQGEHDWQTPTSLVKPWFAELEAPHKEYVAFQHSAHTVWTEEPGKYLYEMVTRVRPFAMQ